MYYVCESPECLARFPLDYDSEWMGLYEEIPDGEREKFFISHHGCDCVPESWVKVSETKHFVLYKEQ